MKNLKKKKIHFISFKNNMNIKILNIENIF
jgi:hypothetical protein